MLAGNWPWWLIVRLLVAFGLTFTNSDSGTSLPVIGDMMRMVSNSAGVSCCFGGASTIT